MAGLFDAVIGSTGVLVCFQFVLSRVRPVLYFELCMLTPRFKFCFKS